MADDARLVRDLRALQSRCNREDARLLASAITALEIGAAWLADLRSERDAAKEEREWQPIETAPRDGTWVLVYGEAISHSFPAIAYRDGDEHWWESVCETGSMLDPTHWMPLPALPSEEKP